MGREDMTPEEIDEAADHGLVRACVRKSCKPKAGYPGGPPRAFWGPVSPTTPEKEEPPC